MSFFSKFFGAGRFERAPRRDFRPEDLPDTRVKLFFDALGIRWSAMVGQNLLYLLFWLPAILWSGVNLLTLVQMLADAPAGADVGAVFQFLRTGYFCKDPDSTAELPVYNRTVSLKDSWAKAKEK